MGKNMLYRKNTVKHYQASITRITRACTKECFKRMYCDTVQTGKAACYTNEAARSGRKASSLAHESSSSQSLGERPGHRAMVVGRGGFLITIRMFVSVGFLQGWIMYLMGPSCLFYITWGFGRPWF